MLFQHVLRNPLASPSTLGVEAGAQLALGIAMLWFPALLGWSRDTATAFGGFAAMAIVFAVAWRFKFQPVAVILTGLVIGPLLYGNRYVADADERPLSVGSVRLGRRVAEPE